MRRYIVGDDLRLPSGGAITSATLRERNKKDSLLTQSSVADLKTEDQASLGNTATVSADVVGLSTNIYVPIRLNSNGNISAIQFTINYDSSKLDLATVQIGTNLPPNTLTVVNGDTPGRINVLIYLPPNGTAVFPAGSFQILRPLFTVQPGSTGFAGVGFGSDPTKNLASDPQAVAVLFNSAPGGVTITSGPTAARVRVSGQVTDGLRGLPNSTVKLTDQTGETRIARTNSFGYYHFTDIAVGETYIISVTGKGYIFAPQIVNVSGEMDDLNLIGQVSQ